jgi:hypothetical protein
VANLKMTSSYTYLFDHERHVNDMIKHFGFLVDKYDFVKLPEYQYVREVHHDFIGKEIVVKIFHEGGHMLEILKPKFDTEKLQKGQKRTVDYDYNSFEHYDLRNLDLQRDIYNSVSSDNFPDKDLWYFSKLLKENPEILKGDLTKLKWKYKLLKRLKIK